MIANMHLMALRDPYQPGDYVRRYLVGGIGGGISNPSTVGIITMEMTEAAERRDAMRKALHRLPKRLRGRATP